jgi:hypothetical protein
MQIITAQNFNFLEIRYSNEWGRGVYFDMKNISILPEECKKDKNGTIHLKKNTIIGTYGGMIRDIDDWKKEKLEYSKSKSKDKIPDKFEYSYKYKRLNYVIDAWYYPEDGNDIGHLINHSNESNVNCKYKTIIIKRNNILKPVVVAETIVDIPLGHQLLVYYSQYYDDIFRPITNKNVRSIYSKHMYDDGDNYQDIDFHL